MCSSLFRSQEVIGAKIASHILLPVFKLLKSMLIFSSEVKKKTVNVVIFKYYVEQKWAGANSFPGEEYLNN